MNRQSPSIAALEPQQDRSRATRRRLLDAAVEELLEVGYARFTAQGVARRAGVSRGALQNHYPSKTLLVADGVRHLGSLQTVELRETLARTPRGPLRIRTALDIIYEQYSSGRFAAILEISLAARHDPDLQVIISGEEQAISDELNAVLGDIVGDAHAPGVSIRWGTTLSTVRGLALLKILGHPEEVVDGRWPATREVAAGLLT